MIEKEYEGGVNLSIANGFMIIGYSSGSDSCFGETSDLKEVTVAGISSPPKVCAVPEELSIEATEIWALEPHGSADGQGLSKSSETDSE